MLSTTTRRALLLSLALTAMLSCSRKGKTTSQPTTPGQPPGAMQSPSAPWQVRGQPAAPDAQSYQQALKAAYTAGRAERGGKNADYIPVLAKVDPNLFGVVVVTVEGQIYTMGDVTSPFSIQSVAKPFTLARLLEELGPKVVTERIGVDATGLPFNSILAIELDKDHQPGNPLVNAGAITAVSMLPAQSADERWQKIMGTYSEFAGRPLTVDQEVYKNESATNTRNRSISWLLNTYEVIKSEPLQALDLYTRQGSVAVTARDLAIMGATLANGGVNPVTGRRVVSRETAARVLAVMMTAGLYEDSGSWAFRVGVPAKSGVGGGIVAVVPGRYAIGTFSPPLDKAGNSVRGQAAISALIEKLGGNVFASQPMLRQAPMGRAGRR